MTPNAATPTSRLTENPVCGIAGWIELTEHGRGASVDLHVMGAALTHRGPDDAGFRSWPGAGFAFQRLALVDLAGGAQPVSDPTGRFWSVFNGEIYNHRELRAELHASGLRPSGTGDATLLPALFQRWGADMLPRMRGMFALAIYDSHRKELLLARDGFGIKPLYWTEDRGTLLFASEIGAVRAGAETSHEISPQSLSHYLSFGYVPDPFTMWTGLHTLPPGHCLLVKDGQVHLRRWWAPTFTGTSDRSVADTVDTLTERLRDSVAAHLDADVPVGAYLSSGVDSSLLVALASRQQPISTFSIGFEGATGSLEELGAARALASRLGTAHHEQVVSLAEYWDQLPHIVACQEQPLADPSAPALWFLARQASSAVKAVLSGEGADELFAGYPIYREPRALAPITRLPTRWQGTLRRVARHLPNGRPGKGYLMRATTPLEQRFLGNVPLFADDTVATLLATPEKAPFHGWDRVRAVYGRTEHLDAVARMQAVSCDTWLPSSILMKADKMAMAHSLEVRVPYLDREVFDLARTLPLSLRVNRNATKIALRLAAAQQLPKEIAWRPKLGFPVPFRTWLDGPFSGHARELFQRCDDPLLDHGAVQSVLAAGTQPGQQRRLWGLMTYLLWREQHATGQPVPRSASATGPSGQHGSHA